MIRSELVQKLCGDFPGLTQREVESVVGAIFDSITEQLAGGGRVELRGFGAFSTRQRDARVGRNPRTGEAVDVDAKRVPYFKPGKEMRERLNLGEVTAEERWRYASPIDFEGRAGQRMVALRTWRNGRRWRLKIFCPNQGVRVQVPPSAPNLSASEINC